LKSSRKWNIIYFTAGYIVLIEGLCIFLFASTMQMYGFTLAVLALVPIIFSTVESYIEFSDTRKKLMAWISKAVICIFGAAIAIAGILTALNIGSITTERFGTIPVYVIAVIGAQLFFLGLIIILAKLSMDSEFKATKFMAYVLGAATASEGVVILGISAPILIEGLGWIMKSTVDLAGIQLMALGLLFLGLLILSEWIQKGSKILGYLRIVVAATIAIEGFAIMALATGVTIDGIGYIWARTITIAGIQLCLLGLGCLVLMGVGSNLASPRLRKVSDLAFIFLLLFIPMAALTSAFTF
jgi:hypothetical protein